MSTGEITRHVADYGKTVIEAKIAFTAWPASGDGWNEPHEPAHAEVTELTLIRTTTRWVWKAPGMGLQKVTDVEVVECPAWLREDIINDARDELDEEARDLLGGDPDEAYDMRRAAE